MSDSLINYFFWSVTLNQNKCLDNMQTALTPKIWILLSEVDLKRFILSVLINYASYSFFWKAIFAFACFPLKIKVAKK